ncbi:MAG: AMP-binding protein [Deltaproteobacteria bacterium]|nr:AMP-binding protein [Deltaproteobacteria bacterium]
MRTLLRTTIGDLFDEVALRFPEREALIDLPRGRRYSYRELQTVVDRLAKGFLKLGIRREEHLALWTPNLCESIITELAAVKIGAVLMTLDTNAQPEQLEYLLGQSDSRTLIMSEGGNGAEHIETIRRLCPEAAFSAPGEMNCRALPELRCLIVISDRTHPGMLTWNGVLEAGGDVPDLALSERQRSCRADDVATLLYTSGTTGAPKGVMSTHFGIINTTLASAENQNLTEEDRLCLSVPLSHMFGCICVVLAGVIKGSVIVIPSETFDPKKVLEAIAAERCTAIYGSPGAFIAMMGEPEYRKFDLRSLRTGIMGGAQCPLEVMKRVTGEMGAKEIVIGYGQTEASSWITMTRRDDLLELRVSTVGRPLPGVEVKLIDPASGREVAVGAVGEICARGFNMKGYYKMPAATANAIDAKGWLHTGDLGTMDADGYVRTTGRMKEVIVRTGVSIYPTEIEEILFRHPKISNVQIFGVPGGTAGEEVAAWIKLEEAAVATEDEILDYCRAKLPASSLPRYIKFVREFPMTLLGKVQKFRMREIAIKEYGLE